MHGCVVQSAGDLSFELLGTAEGATLYVDDHEDDYDTKKMAGKLTVLKGSVKFGRDLIPAGGNRLVVKGVKLDKRAKAVAAITENRKRMTIRITVKRLLHEQP